MGKRLLITGSRDWADIPAIREQLIAASNAGFTTLISGNCPKGADRIAETEWEKLGLEVERHPADWRPMPGIYNKRAGFERNRKMVESGADACLAFIRNESGGATHCASEAQKAGIPTKRILDNESRTSDRQE